MFTLHELQLIQSVMADEKIGYPYKVAEVLSSVKGKLTENIADLEQREHRQRAALALRATGSAPALVSAHGNDGVPVVDAGSH